MSFLEVKMVKYMYIYFKMNLYYIVNVFLTSFTIYVFIFYYPCVKI